MYVRTTTHAAALSFVLWLAVLLVILTYANDLQANQMIIDQRLDIEFMAIHKNKSNILRKFI